MTRLAFDSFSVVALPGWEDITGAVEGDDPPFTRSDPQTVCDRIPL